MSDVPELRLCTTKAPPARLDGAVGGVKARAAYLNASFWGRGTTLKIGFIGGSLALRERVRDLASSWITQTAAHIGFEFWTALDVNARAANIRVSFLQDGRSWSNVGKYASQVPRHEATMNLGWMTEDLDEERARAVVLHEFGHALGLIHEHLSPVHTIRWNRRQVTADLMARGWTEEDVRNNMFAVYASGQIFATDLDRHSIMMYPIPESWTTNGFTAPWNTVLTDNDKKLIREVYGVRPGAMVG